MSQSFNYLINVSLLILIHIRSCLVAFKLLRWPGQTVVEAQFTPVLHGAAPPLSMETQASYPSAASYIAIDTQHSENAPAAATVADPPMEVDCDETACEEEHAPGDELDDTAEDTVVNEGSCPTGSEPASEILLGILAKNRHGVWFSCQRSRYPLWAFYAPVDASLTWEERGKCKEVECVICHAQR